MLGEAFGTAPYLHPSAVLSLEAHRYHLESLHSKQTAWPHPGVCLIQGLDEPSEGAFLAVPRGWQPVGVGTPFWELLSITWLHICIFRWTMSFLRSGRLSYTPHGQGLVRVQQPFDFSTNIGCPSCARHCCRHWIQQLIKKTLYLSICICIPIFLPHRAYLVVLHDKLSINSEIWPAVQKKMALLWPF